MTEKKKLICSGEKKTSNKKKVEVYIWSVNHFTFGTNLFAKSWFLVFWDLLDRLPAPVQEK